MALSLLKKMFGNRHERDIARIMPLVDTINHFEASLESVTQEELIAKTQAFKTHVAEGESLDDILAEAYAMVRESSKRVLKMRHFDVQLLGGIILHQGKIAEMVTGEGKTLVATLAAYLNALTGKGVHVITVNDYLAKRDREWMGPVFEYLGLTVGVIQHDMSPSTRRKEYACDITYGTNNEFGFDYLRDHMVYDATNRSQRSLHYAIIDEVDSILIDEARTPLIISGAVDQVTHCYGEVKSLVRDLVNKQEFVIGKKLRELKDAIQNKKDDDVKKLLFTAHRGAPKHQDLLKIVLEDASVKRKLDDAVLFFNSKGMENEKSQLEEDLFYTYEERSREIVFTPKGEDTLTEKYQDQYHLEDIDETLFQIQSDEHLSDDDKQAKEREAMARYEAKSRRISSMETLLRAYVMFKKDVDYVVSDNKVTIVDEFTGRMMPGRRYSDGIHEALEAKENVTIQKESQTLASITFQNYFRMYGKLAGMTGTAETESAEFRQIYKLDVVVIPTNRPLRRVNYNDVIYKTEKEKFTAVIEEIKDCYHKGQPVLVGTASIEASERLSRLLKSEKIVHEVLNAKHHAREADIIKLAGQRGAVTLATNMAGRGTDIVLGSGIESLGGLHVIGTERHESRRIDNQLRGRSGRQGDQGSSRFYISCEDNLMRIFGNVSDRMMAVMDRFGVEGQDIQNPLITRSIATAQKRVETHNFEIRKQLIKYDDIMNKQRTVIYARRNEVLDAADLTEYIHDVIEDVLEVHLANYIFEDNSPEEWDIPGLLRWVQHKFLIRIEPADLKGETSQEIHTNLCNILKKNFETRESIVGKEHLAGFTRHLILMAIDRKWKDHLYAMDQLREAVGFRAYAQKDPLIEYQHEGYQMFETMIEHINDEILDHLFKMQFIQTAQPTPIHKKSLDYSHPDQFIGRHLPSSAPKLPPQNHPQRTEAVPVRRDIPKVGRNDPCPCGSGRKYKKCCGQ